MTIIDVVIKIGVAFIIIMIYSRISSNIQLKPLSSSEQVGNIVLGAIVGGALAEEVDVWMLILAMLLWCSLQLLLRWGKFRSSKLTAFVDGERIPLMLEGKVVVKGFKKTRLLPEDFILTLHENGIESMDDVWNAWFETDGTTSIDKRGQPQESIALISNGTLVDGALEAIKKDNHWLKSELQARGLGLKEVFVAEWFEGDLDVYPFPK